MATPSDAQKKKEERVFLAILVFAVIVLAVWFFLLRKKKTSSTPLNTPPSTAPTSTCTAATCLPPRSCVNGTCTPPGRNYAGITDCGFGSGYLRGWFDMQNLGVKNDYCRYVGDANSPWVSCALAGSSDQYTKKPPAGPVNDLTGRAFDQPTFPAGSACYGTTN